MASAGSLTRLEILADALVERGLPEERAVALSTELIAQHPFVGRHGVAALEGAMREAGLAAPTAQETARVLLGVELLSRGVTYGRLLRALRHHGVPAHEAEGIALESAHLQRAIAAGKPASAPAGVHAELIGWVVLALVVGAAIAALVHPIS